MTNRFLLGAGVALAVALGGAQAHAQLGGVFPPPGTPGAFYIGPEGGWTKLTNQTDTINGQIVTGTGSAALSIPRRTITANFDSGFNVGGRLGYQWGPWRFEEEYNYRRNGLSSLSATGIFGNTITSGGQFTGQRFSHAIMTNVIYDFTIGWPISPHIGAGIGAVDIIASVTMKFGAPPPPPPPLPPAPPPPPPPKVYLVFFDWDKYNITPEGQQIIQLAAQQYRAGGSVRLQVTGYTDLSGSAGYNQRLSERRANAVANALAALGVARTDMVVTGRGMNDPRVPTAPGVREPQNRRVEILFP